MVLQIHTGDHRVFEELFHHHKEVLYRHVFRMIPDTEICNDIIQEFFLSIWIKNSSWKIKTSAISYLYQSVRNKKMAPRNGLDKLYGDIQKKFAPVADKLNAAYAAKDSLLVVEIKQSEEWKAFEEAEGNFFKTADNVVSKIVSKNKNSWCGPLLTLNMYTYFSPGNDNLYDDLSQGAKNSHYGQILMQ